MNLSGIDTLNHKTAAGTQKSPGQTPAAATKQEAELRQAAEQFEAVLLMQLTSALNGSGDDSEDSLFGQDGGTNLAKQMFSEQMATTMAQSGGVGLADMLMNQFAAKNAKALEKNTKLDPAVSAAVREIKDQNPGAAAAAGRETSNANSPKAVSADASSSTSYSAFEGQASKLTRPRIVPGVPTIASSLSGSADVAAAQPNSVAVADAAVRFQMPVKGRISSEFGTRFHPIDRTHKFHKGVDIAAPRGTPIGASAEGTVIFSGWSGGYGKTVIIEHADGRQTRYGHADKLFVEEGDRVEAGQTIGAVGSTGKSTGPHLHFEIIENDRRVDPLNFIAKGLRFGSR